MLAQTRRDLRSCAMDGLLATALGVFTFWLLPLTAPPRPFIATGLLSRLLLLERSLDFPSASFPSFHVLWPLLAARLYAGRGRARRLATGACALPIAASRATTRLP